MKRKITTPTLILFVAAVALLLVSSVGIARAALTESKTYDAEIDMKNIGVALKENGDETENLLEDIVPETFKVGVETPEFLNVVNTGDIDEYVRVVVKQYWTDADGKKMESLEPGLIELTFDDKNWIIDDDESTPERTVLYYTKALAPGEESEDFVTAILINNLVKQRVAVENEDFEDKDDLPDGYYIYDGKKFALDVEADAVQTHHAEDAIKSAWGIDVIVDETAKTLKLK